MATKTPRAETKKTVVTLTHEEASRKNIPTAEYQSVMHKEEQSPLRVAFERGATGLNQEKQRRNRDLDPQLVWRGKDEQDWSDLVVAAPPLYIQEKVHPKVLIDDLQRGSAAGRDSAKEQFNLFADFNGLPSESARTEFYQHDANWSNRMILGDSLQVMASLAEREGLRGQVQCIYIDPPYGIKFKLEFSVVDDQPRREGRKCRSHHARARAGEGLSGYLARWGSFLFDIPSGPADSSAGSADGFGVCVHTDW